MTRNIDISSGSLEIGIVSGINNVTDEAKLEPRQLVYAYNIDISNLGRPARRDGTVKKFTPSGSCHSMWGDNKNCFFVDGGNLKKLNEDYTATTLRSNVTDYHMSFCEVNDQYYYVNPSTIGYIYNGVSNLLPVPTDEHKYAHLPGQHIEYYNGRLYVARNETIWYSDVNYLGQVDRRKNFIQFENEITMMKAVDDGLWICCGDINRQTTYFVGGATREDFVRKRVADYGCKEGSAVKVKDGRKVGEGFSGTVAIWTADEGICIGANSGQFMNITDKKFYYPAKRFGAGLFREINGLAQYITNLWE